MSQKSRIVAFNNPLWTDKPPYCNQVVLMSEEDVVSAMKRWFPERDYEYETALLDFIVVHWAWFIENEYVSSMIFPLDT